MVSPVCFQHCLRYRELDMSHGKGDDCLFVALIKSIIL